MNDFKDLFERIKVEHYAKHSKESEILNLNLSYGRKKDDLKIRINFKFFVNNSIPYVRPAVAVL